MSDKLSEADLALGRACAKVDGATMDNIAFGNLIAEIDRLRAENKELREEDLNGTKATVKAIEQITYYRNEVNRLNNVIAERDTRIDTLREIVRECGPELKEYLEDRDHDIWGELILDDDGNEQCPADCRKCYQERLLARIDAALGLPITASKTDDY